MKIFLYEFVTAGGMIDRPSNEIPDSLVAEGQAMARTLSNDLAASGAEVDLMADARFMQPLESANFHRIDTPEREKTLFQKLAASADATIVIAPEFDGILQDRAERVSAYGGRLIGPSIDAITLAADKHRTAAHLHSLGIPSTQGVLLQAGELLPVDFPYPAVLKPRWGAGSQGIALILDPAAATGQQTPCEARLECYVPGTPTSVAVLCGPCGLKPLTACRQLLSQDGRFTYLGGSLPLQEDLNERACRLATAAVAAFEGMLGYVGVDLILAEASRGDTVVEVNPRLTTSYIGLRKASPQNLAATMLQWADGQDCNPVFFDTPISFDCAGKNPLVSIP